MPEFLKSPFANGPHVDPLDTFVRLVIAAALGGVVAWIYCRTRNNGEVAPSFPTTLVLLSVLIAMVTQVIGDNVARAFSLVGALSIVRFRTVVRDTQDTAYVIFAVVVGMAVGAKNPWVGLIGLGVTGVAAFIMQRGFAPSKAAESDPEYLLSLRVGLGHDLEKVLESAFDGHIQERKLLSMGTAKQGIAVDATYLIRLRAGGSADAIISALNKVEGVQSVHLERRGMELE